MTIADINRPEFNAGVARAKKTLAAEPTIKGWDRVSPDAFKEKDVPYILDLHDYAQWHELEGAVLVSVVRMFQSLTLAELLS